MQTRDLAQEAIANPKVATVVAGIATGSGIGTVFEFLPLVLGVVGSVVGIVLSLVLIWAHYRRTHAELSKLRAEERLAEEKYRRLTSKQDSTSPP